MRILINNYFERNEKKLDGKNYSIWAYKVNATINGQITNCTLKSFTKSPIELSAGQEVEAEVKQNNYNGNTYTDYIIKPEKKESSQGFKKGGYTKYSLEAFKKLSLECWIHTNTLAAGLPEELIPEARIKMFDKLLGVASILVDLSTLEPKTNTEKVSEVFNDTVPF